ETANEAAQEASQLRSADGLERAELQPFVDQRLDRAAEPLDVMHAFVAERQCRRCRARTEQAVLVRDREEVAVSVDETEQPCDAPGELRLEVGRVVRASLELGEHLAHSLVEQPAEQVFLLREVIVYGPDSDSSSLGDVLDPRRVETPLGKDVLRGFE